MTVQEPSAPSVRTGPCSDCGIVVERLMESIDGFTHSTVQLCPACWNAHCQRQVFAGGCCGLECPLPTTSLRRRMLRIGNRSKKGCPAPSNLPVSALQFCCAPVAQLDRAAVSYASQILAPKFLSNSQPALRSGRFLLVRNEDDSLTPGEEAAHSSKRKREAEAETGVLARVMRLAGASRSVTAGGDQIPADTV